jgi:hypothetical protein
MSELDDRTLEERIAAREPRAMACGHGHPGALEVVCRELHELRAQYEDLRRAYKILFDENKELKNERKT